MGLRSNITTTTRAVDLSSKFSRGTAFLPTWRENTPIGLSKLRTPYYDSIKFVLNNEVESDEIITCLISVTQPVKVSKSQPKGRGGEIKQIVNKGDYNITFNIQLISDAFAFNNINPSNSIEVQTGIINSGIYNDNVYPNDKLVKLLEVFNGFYDDESYSSIEIESLYLNNNLGVYNIVPYNIQTSQNNESTNLYNITIQAYSDFTEDTSEYRSEIIAL